MKTYKKLAVLILSVCFSIAASTARTQSAQGGAGMVYVMSNKAQNSVLVFQRAADGRLTFVEEQSTRGDGTGVTLDPLMSQGAIALRADGKLLFAVNPASGQVSSFRVSPSGTLRFASIVPSGGVFPVSVTVHGAVVYVLNQLGIANISGFSVTDTGQLQPFAHSTNDALAGGALAQPAEVSFTPDGNQLLVTEKGTNLIDVFAVQPDGNVSAPVAQPSSGNTPFGFAFDSTGTVVVSEVENRLPLRATASSYQLSAGGGLAPVSARVRDHQSGACWVVITGQIAWVVNTGTAVISAYEIGANGALTVVNEMAGTTGDATSPIDAAASADGNYLYVLKSATGEIAAFAISGSNLAPLFTVSGLPLSIQGIVAR